MLTGTWTAFCTGAEGRTEVGLGQERSWGSGRTEGRTGAGARAGTEGRTGAGARAWS